MDWKGIGIFSVILLMMVFCNVSIKSEFKINEEVAKTPAYTMGALGGLGNVAGGIIEGATTALEELLPKDEPKDRYYNRNFLIEYKKEAKKMDKKEFIKYVYEQWENKKWYEKLLYGLGNIDGMTASSYWEIMNLT